MRYHDGAIGRDRIQHRRNIIIGRQQNRRPHS
jgi:hypothetical protein